MADRRTARSRNYLVGALITLLETRPIQSITVHDLVDQAELARSTFYSLFEDKQHFVDEIIEEMFVGLQKETKPEKFSRSGGVDDGAQQKYYIKHFQYIAQNADFFRVMLSENGSPSFRKRMEDSARVTYERIFADLDEQTLPFPKDFLIQYIISAHMGLTIKWLENGMIYSPTYMAELIRNLTFNGIFCTLGLDRKVNLPK